MKDFGSPETWNMKVDEFLEKKSQASLIEDLAPGPLRDQYLNDFDPTQETYEEYKRRKSIPIETRPLNMANGGLSRTELAEKLGIKAKTIESAKVYKTRLWQSILKYMDAEKTGQTRPEYYTPKKGVKVNEAVKEIKKFSGAAAQSLPRETYGNVKTNIGQVKDLLNKSKEPLDIRQVKEMLPNLNQETIRTSLNVLKKDSNFKNKIISIDPATTAPYKVNQDIKKLLSDKRIINVLDNGKFPTDAQIKSVLKTDPTITERRSVDLAETLTGRRDIGDFKVPTKYKNLSSQYLTEVDRKSGLFGPRKTRARTYYENELTKILNLPENIRKLRTTILSKIQNIVPELKGVLAVDEIAGLTSSVRNLSTPYGIFGQVLGKDFNTAEKGFGIDGLKGKYEKKLAGLSPDDPERLRIQKNYNQAVDKFETAANKNNPTKKVKGFKIVFEPPSKAIGNKKIYNQYKDLFDAHYDKYKFSFKVPADTDSLIDISNKLDTPVFQKTVKNRLARLIGKGGKVGALVGLGTLAGTGFALADEPGVEGAKETSLMDDILSPKGAAAGAALLTKPGRAIAGNLLRTLSYLDTPLVGGAFTASSISDLKKDIEEGKQTDVSALELTGPAAFSNLTARELGLYGKKTGIKKAFDTLLRGGMSRVMAERLLPVLAKGSTYATPLVELGIQTYNAKQRLEEAKEKYGTDDMVPTAMGMAPKQYVEELASELPDIDRTGAMGGGIMRVGLKNGPEDPSKRKFMKLGIGIASLLPFGIGRLAKKPAVKKAVENAPVAAEQGWSWVKDNFWTVIDTVKKKAKTFAKLKDGEVTMHKDMEVIDGPESIRVRYKTDNNNIAETVYIKPSKEVNPETGEIIDIPGDFEEYQDVYRMGKDDYYKDFEEEIIDPIDNVKKIITED